MANLYDKAGLVNIPVGYQDGFLYNIKPEDNTLGFRFNRDSAATRVNKEGLIEQVGYFGPELVQNGDFEQIGSELVTNGNFDTDSDWTKGTGTTISGGAANFVNATGVSLYQNIGTQTGTVKVEFTVTNYTSGTLNVYSGSNQSVGVVNVSANALGTYTAYVVRTGGNVNIIFGSSDSFTGSIDNVSVKEVGQDWTLGTGWSIGDGKVVKTSGAGASLSQTLPIAVIGKKYKFTFDANVTSGVANASLYGVTIPNFTTSGSQEHTVTATSTSGFNFYAAADFNGSIDNVSVTEVLGDKPRIDYTDSLTSPSFLLEPQRTNLITYSEDFSNSSWAKNNCTINSNNAISPDGTQNADKLDFTTSNGEIVRTTTGFVVGQEYTMSFYAKTESGTLDFTYGNMNYVSVSGTATTEWQRFELTQTLPSATRFPKIQTTEIGSLLLWGFQVEQGSYATSYIPTSGSTVTRAQETCTGAGNVSTFNSTEGVLYAEIAALADDETFRMISVSDGTNDNRVRINYTATNQQIQSRVIVGGAQQANISKNLNVTDFTKIALSYKQNQVKLYINGELIGTNTSVTMPSANTFNVLNFDGSNGSNIFYGKTKGVYVFNEALTDDELQQLTGPEYNSFAALAAAYNYTVI